MAVVWAACGVPVYGDWKYLYRAINRMAALADVALSEHRNLPAATTNSETSSAPDLACANTFLPLHGAFTTCAGQHHRARYPGTCLNGRLRGLRISLRAGSKAGGPRSRQCVTAPTLGYFHS